MNKVVELLAKVLYGREVAIAITVLNLIMKALKDKDASDLAEFVYAKLPAKYKTTCEKEEFLLSVQKGREFIIALTHCFR